ncbi:MAG: flagellar hook-length control protein FliK [Geobacter sp.]|nr:flagellar hook-length control protein FliK [Geobacter sp.]
MTTSAPLLAEGQLLQEMATTEEKPADENDSTLQDPAALSGENAAALSVMHLLNALHNQLTEGRKVGSSESENADAQKVEQLLEEVRSLMTQDGSLTEAMQGELRGALNPATTAKEGESASLLMNESGGQPGQTSDAQEALTQLVAALNSSLMQAQQGTSNSSTDRSALHANETTPALAPVQAGPVERRATEQPSLVKLADIGTAGSLTGTPSDVTPPVAQDSSTQVAAPADLHEVKAGRFLQEKAMFAAQATQKGAAGERTASEEPLQSAAEQEGMDPGKIEILVVSEESSAQEQGTGLDQRNSQPSDVKKEGLQHGMHNLFAKEAVAQQLAAGQATAPEGTATPSREQIVNQVKEKLAEHRFVADSSQVTIRLHPEQLGELKINVRMDDQKVRVEIVAENQTVKDALLQGADSLKEALARQNVSMERFDVSTDSRQFFNQGFREGRQQEQPQVAPRLASWLTGHAGEAEQTAVPSWKPQENALLDMIM